MRRLELQERFSSCLPILQRSGIPEKKIEVMQAAIEKLDGPGISRRVKWLRHLEHACSMEAEHYRDLSPKAWERLVLLEPGNADIKKLKSYRKAVREVFKS